MLHIMPIESDTFLFQHFADDYDHSLTWSDFQDEWIENKIQEIMDDTERDLNKVIADYCETTYVGMISGIKLNHWGEYDQVIRKAMKTCPELKDFVERAANMQANKDFNKEMKQ